MGFIGSLLGIGGNGSNYQAQGTNVLQPTTVDQANNAYGQTQSGISQQQNFLNALQAQNGIGNQSDVFGQQQGLAALLAQQALGNGPNPALTQLAQTTGQNIAAQNALMAGQRGSGANAGLIARQAANLGSNVQQQAAGQGATLRAQQQLAAQQALGQQQANMAGLATQQVGQQANALGGYNNAAQGQQQNLLSGIANQNNSNVQMQGNINSANAGVAGVNAQQQGGILGGLLGGVGTLVGGGLGTALGKVGSSIVGKAYGGQINDPGGSFIASCINKSRGGRIPGVATVSGDSYSNDTIPAMLSPGEIVVPRSHASDPDMAAEFARAVAMRWMRK